MFQKNLKEVVTTLVNKNMVFNNTTSQFSEINFLIERNQ